MKKVLWALCLLCCLLASVACSEDTAGREEFSIGDRYNQIIDTGATNVTEGEYLMLYDYENYAQAAQIGYKNNFGKIELVAGSPYVTHGSSAAKLTIVGREETQRHNDPMLIVFTRQEYFNKQDFSDVDMLEVDFYNAMDYDVNVRFTNNIAYMAQNAAVETYTLSPGANHIKIDFTAFKQMAGTTLFERLIFVFDRGELFPEDRVIYTDNFRAHIAR